MIVKTFGVLGPIMTAIGAFLLAYDVFRRPIRLVEHELFYKGHLQGLKDFQEINMGVFERLSTPPYTEEEKNKLIREQEAKYETRREEIEKNPLKKN